MEKTDIERRMAEFRSRLKKLGLKVTAQRTAVHEAMLKLGHASADMVTEEILREGKTKVTVASVYNILTQLASLDLYQHRMSSNNKMYFDVNNRKHMHLYDTVNHVHMEISDDILYKNIEDMLLSKRFKGFKVDGLDIQILAHPSRRKK
ncbi:MAG: transcriptional repressor [Bacteroidales bacterium]|nr:transcriptional repressor [Bacteroidales bacterium]